MTKAELISKIAEEVGITKNQADKMLATFIDTVVDEIQNNGNMTISGLGSFTVVQREARKGHNPQTKQPIDIPASKAVKFKCAKALKDAVN